MKILFATIVLMMLSTVSSAGPYANLVVGAMHVDGRQHAGTAYLFAAGWRFDRASIEGSYLTAKGIDDVPSERFGRLYWSERAWGVHAQYDMLRIGEFALFGRIGGYHLAGPQNGNRLSSGGGVGWNINNVRLSLGVDHAGGVNLLMLRASTGF